MIGTRAGGIPDIVADERNGLLVPPEDAVALAGAMARFAGDATLQRALAAGAARDRALWLATPEEYARRTRELVDRVTA